MKAEARAALDALNVAREGQTDWLYLDRLGLVSTGTGFLVDPLPLARALAWTLHGAPATPEQLEAAWYAVKARQDLAGAGGGPTGPFPHLTEIRATPESLAALYEAKVRGYEASLRLRFPAWDAWPWQAQATVMSMCWAGGPGLFAKFPHFVGACRGAMWGRAADECHMADDGDESLQKRNAQNEAWLRAAAA